MLLPLCPTATLPVRAYGLAVPRDGDLARIIGVRRLVTLATNYSCCVGRFSGVCYFHAGGAVNRR
jgi:hypothetical protein